MVQDEKRQVELVIAHSNQLQPVVLGGLRHKQETIDKYIQEQITDKNHIGHPSNIFL